MRLCTCARRGMCTCEHSLSHPPVWDQHSSACASGIQALSDVNARDVCGAQSRELTARDELSVTDAAASCFRQVRLSRKLRIYLAAGPTAAPERVKKADVLTRLERGVWINVFGLGSTLLGLQVSLRVHLAQLSWHAALDHSTP